MKCLILILTMLSLTACVSTTNSNKRDAHDQVINDKHPF